MVFAEYVKICKLLLTYVIIRSKMIAVQRKGVDEIRYGELKMDLRKAGCYQIGEGGNHEIWFSPITGQKFPVSRHNREDVKPGTLKSIKKAAGLK